jgi:hypothetical protein
MADELAEKARDWDRPVDPDRDVRAAALNQPDAGAEYATEDLVIERTDLGPESVTFVAKGDRIPADVADFPRRRRADWPAEHPPPRRKG